MGFFDKHKHLKFWLPAFIFVAAVIVLDRTIGVLPSIFSWLGTLSIVLRPFIVGFILAFVLYIPAGKMESGLKKCKKFKPFPRFSRGISVIITYVIFISIIAVALYFLLPKLWTSVMDLLNQIPGYYQEALAFIESNLDANGLLFGFDFSEIKSHVTPEAIMKFFNLSNISQYAAEVFKFGSAIIDVFLSVIISIYMLLGRDHLIKTAGRLLSIIFPKRALSKCYHYAKRTSDIFYSYIYSQLLDALVVFILLAIVLSIIKVPYAILFALLIGLLNLIPYFGAIIGGAVVAGFTIFTGGIVMAIVTLITVVAVQQIDANIIQPKIVGNTVGIKAIYVLFAITVGGGLFGFGGMLIGVPIIATIRMLLIDLLAARNENRSANINN